MTNVELTVLKRKLEVLQDHVNNIEHDIVKARDFFRYQNSELDSLSEDLIVIWQDFLDVQSLIDTVEDIIDNN